MSATPSHPCGCNLEGFTLLFSLMVMPPFFSTSSVAAPLFSTLSQYPFFFYHHCLPSASRGHTHQLHTALLHATHFHLYSVAGRSAVFLRFSLDQVPSLKSLALVTGACEFSVGAAGCISASQEVSRKGGWAHSPFSCA